MKRATFLTFTKKGGSKNETIQTNTDMRRGSRGTERLFE